MTNSGCSIDAYKNMLRVICSETQHQRWFMRNANCLSQEEKIALRELIKDELIIMKFIPSLIIDPAPISSSYPNGNLSLSINGISYPLTQPPLYIPSVDKFDYIFRPTKKGIEMNKSFEFGDKL